MFNNVAALSSFIAIALALPHGGSYSRRDAPPSTLPICGPTPQACACPAGTFYQESTTYAFWPVPVQDVQAIVGNFHETAWFGTSPESVTGDPYTPGATRVLLGGVPDSTEIFPVTEKLTSFTSHEKNRGFFMKFQDDAPLNYTTSSGATGYLYGTWDTIDLRATGGSETFMLWNIYVCFSATFNFRGFHESAMLNVTSILRQQKKLTEHQNMVGPISF